MHKTLPEDILKTMTSLLHSNNQSFNLSTKVDSSEWQAAKEPRCGGFILAHAATVRFRWFARGVFQIHVNDWRKIG